MKPLSVSKGSVRVFPPRLRFLASLLILLVVLLQPQGSQGAVRLLGIRIGPLRRAHFRRLAVLNPLRWVRGESDALRSRIQSLEQELSKLHMDHVILMDRLRQIQAKRMKEYTEQQRVALSQSQEVKKVTEKLQAEAAEQVKKVELKAAKEKEVLLQTNKRNLEALQTKMEDEVEVKVERAVKKALDEQQARHKEEIAKLIARHKEQLEKLREQLEKARASAGLELKGDFQARLEQAQKEAEERLAAELERAKAQHEKELSTERKRHRRKEKESQAKLTELEDQFKSKEQELMEKVRRHQEQVAQLQSDLGRVKRTPNNNAGASGASAAGTTGKRARSSKTATPPGQVPSFNKVNK